MAHEKVYGFCESKCKVEIVSKEQYDNDVSNLENKSRYFQEFTFIVDSDEALAKWANNDTSNGEDYTSVLIKKGTWSCDKTIENAKTKRINGEVESTIIINSEKGIAGTYSLEQINNVNLIVNGKYGFYVCKNLTHCTAEVFSEEDFSYAFYNCNNLINCKSELSNDNLKTIIGFQRCENLTHCTCIAFYNRTTTVYCFNECSFLTNCFINDSYTTSTFVEQSCLTTYYNYCTNVINCIAGKKSSVVGSHSYYNYAFQNCNNVFMCKGYGIVVNSYFSSDNSKPIANTFEGGFNDIKSEVIW